MALPLQPLDARSFALLLEQAEVVELGREGPKLWRLPDGDYVKRFARRRRLSSAAVLSRAERFCHNAEQLARRGIPAPQPLAAWRLDATGESAVRYRPLEGETLRALLAAAPPAQQAAILTDFFRFLAQLHERGVLFRSLQFGNVLRLPQGGHGLIDIADMRLQRRPLGPLARLRNFRHLCHDARDWHTIAAFGWQRAATNYLEAARLPAPSRALFRLGWRTVFLPRHGRTHRPVRRTLRKRLRNLFGTRRTEGQQHSALEDR